jgi:hypothetical protein
MPPHYRQQKLSYVIYKYYNIKYCKCKEHTHRKVRMPRKRALGQAFRERLAESSIGRASRSRRRSDVKAIDAIADYLYDHKARAISKI